jgi:lipid-A-disaccharide synthase
VTTILLACGESSGEAHAARLVREIKAREPSCVVRALGGRELEKAGAEVIFPLDRYAVMGFAEIVTKLPSFVSLERSLASLLERGGIDLFIPVDYPGLNLRLCRWAKKSGVPVLYFVSPQVWAWGAWRVGRMKRRIDLMAVIFPFEADIYRRAGIPAVFVGYPMLEEIPPPERPKEVRAPGEPFLVLLFPGSRRQEFDRTLPVLREAAAIIKRRHEGARFEVGLAPLIDEGRVRIPPEMRSYCGVTRNGIGELANASLVLATSGTVTLQCALSGTPMVVVYRTSPATFSIGRLLVKIPRIAMPNVLAGRAVVPELIQWKATPARIAAEALSLLGDPERYRAVSSDLISLREPLRVAGGVGRLAEAALRMSSREPVADIVSLFDGRETDRENDERVG